MKALIFTIYTAMAMSLLIALVMLAGCAPPLTADLIKALSNDTASFCARSGIRGGVGALVGGVSGGYGSAEFEFCRSNYPNSKVTLSPDGSISITHGSEVE
mgnify:FL=1